MERTDVVLEIAHPASAGNGHDVLPLRQHPGERQLRRAAALGSRERSHLIDQRQIAREVLALKARVGAPIVIGREIIGALDGTGEKAAAQRTVGDQADAEALAGFQYAVLGIARPQRVLALQRRDAMHAVRALERLRGNLREPEVAYLARAHQLRHGAHGVLDRHVRIHAMQVIQVDVSDLETLQARLAGLADPLGTAVDGRRGRVGGIAHEAELGGEEGGVAPPTQRAPDQLLVGVRAVYVGGVEEIHAPLERPVQRGDRLAVVVRAVELAHAHATQAQSRHGGAIAAECACLQANFSSRGAGGEHCAPAGQRHEYTIRERGEGG